MNQKTEDQDITSKQQDFSPDGLLSGQVVVDEISVEQMNRVKKFLEDKYSSKVDAIVKDFDDDKDEENVYSRTYLERRAPLAFSLNLGFNKPLKFHINWNDTENRYSYGKELTKFNEVAIIFEDGVTTRSAFGKKVTDNIERKRKLKHISKLEPTIVEVLDRLIEIASKERQPYLDARLEAKKFNAQEKLRDFEDELKSVKAFEKKYDKSFSDDGSNDFIAIEAGIETKIDAEKARLKEVGLL
jgi:hypothetical protein